ncbi:MAG: ABC transporter ATP-binding protein [Lachnospiraceae bacterium]|nr:ABC transporter ATP-binding protein [Lachnospiraceae bacterium]
MPILTVSNLQKIYTTRFGGTQVKALSDVSFTIDEGEYVAIMGESGAGKTTLLNILATLDRPTSGKVFIGDYDLSHIKESQLATFRRQNLGFVFQDFNLLDTFSVKDNIILPLILGGEKPDTAKQKVMPVALRLGIAELLNKFPYEISGGQKQRVAVARALITNPKLVMADEPTGALDSKATDSLLQIFRDINSTGQTILMVTHSVKAASHANRVLFIKDGVVYHQIHRGKDTNEQLYQKISDTLTLLATGGDVA